MTIAASPRRSSTSAERGAAMVEAIVVISTMLVFLGLIVFLHKAYGAKLDLQQTTRGDVLWEASHGCPNGGTTQSSVGDGDSPATRIARESGLEESNAASGSFNTKATQLTTTVSGRAIVDKNATGQNGRIEYVNAPLSARVSAKSTCTCNEKKYPSQLTAWFQYGVNLIGTGGGVVDIFH